MIDVLSGRIKSFIEINKLPHIYVGLFRTFLTPLLK